MKKRVCYINIIILFLLIFPFFNASNLICASTKDLSVYRLVRSGQWINASSEVLHNFGKSIEGRYNLSVESIRYKRVGGVEGTPEGIFENFKFKIALEVAKSQALAGLVVERTDGNKKVLDGNAVTLGYYALEDLAKQYGIRIVVLGNEGKTRDDAPALPIGMIFNPDGQNGTLYFLNDAVEGTNYTINNEPGGWSVAVFFDELNPYSTDGYRVAITYTAPRPAEGLDPWIRKVDGELNLVAQFKKIADAKGVSLQSFYENTVVLVLGDRSRHNEVIEELGRLKEEKGLNYITIPDGDCIPRVVASYGLKVDGRELVVMLVGGANEEYMARAATSLSPFGHVVSHYLSADTLRRKESPVTDLSEGGQFSEEELAEFVRLGITNPLAIETERSISGKPIFVASSITGGRESAIGNIAKDLPGITKIPDTEGRGGIIIIRSLVPDHNGMLLVVEAIYRSDNLEESLDAIWRANKNIFYVPEERD